MGMEVSFEYKNEVLTVLVTGTFELEAANRCADQTLEAAIHFHAPMALIDCQNLQGSFSIRDRFSHIDHLSEIILNAQSNNRLGTFHFAYFANPTILDPHRFGETVARNRGINIFVTELRSEAIEWLDMNAE